ncbi:MAG: methyltransferase [Candidatus Woesearchaeota archaeon]|jgi:protein-S-isoprenylcysteine O-methyltransferase Ste14
MSRLKRGLQLYFSSVILYGLGILLFHYLPYYQRTLNDKTQLTLLGLFWGYLVLAPILYFFFVKEYSENKSYHLAKAAIRNGRSLFQSSTQLGLEKEEKVALLFILVKIFFLPTMIGFFYGNWSNLSFNNFQWYPFLLTLLFTIDTLIFSLGYIFESHKLNNIVKSVEPTFFGWFVALICYPPFNSIVGAYIPWGASDQVTFWSSGWTITLRIIIILLLAIYVWATVALGMKSSNLTNRGIVTKFPYSIVRHPAYISKNLMWWVTLLPVMNWPFALGMGVWSVIYFFRAWTEERHLSKDPDYVEYCKKVKWRFIPYLI